MSTSKKEQLAFFNKKLKQCLNCKLGYLEENKGRQVEGRLCAKKVDNVEVVFVGQNPWHTQELRPKVCPAFGDKAGDFLDKILKDVGLTDVSYLTNAVRCSNPNNAVNVYHMRICGNLLWYELNIIKPKLVVAMGSIARKTLKGDYGKTWKFNGHTMYAIAHPSSVQAYNSMPYESYKDYFDIIKHMLKKM